MTKTNLVHDEQHHHNRQKKREKWLAFVQHLHPDIAPGAIRLMDEMRLVSHALYQVGESSLAVTGLSFAQYRILMGLLFCERIEDRKELNPSEISKRQGTSRNTISALIRNLENEGFIERHLDKNDRRKFNISLTEAGRDLALEHAHRHMSAINRCFSALSHEEQETLSHLLTKLSSNLKEVEE